MARGMDLDDSGELGKSAPLASSLQTRSAVSDIRRKLMRARRSTKTFLRRIGEHACRLFLCRGSRRLFLLRSAFHIRADEFWHPRGASQKKTTAINVRGSQEGYQGFVDRLV